jgi:hypothetical protein
LSKKTAHSEGGKIGRWQDHPWIFVGPAALAVATVLHTVGAHSWGGKIRWDELALYLAGPVIGALSAIDAAQFRRPATGWGGLIYYGASSAVYLWFFASVFTPYLNLYFSPLFGIAARFAWQSDTVAVGLDPREPSENSLVSASNATKIVTGATPPARIRTFAAGVTASAIGLAIALIGTLLTQLLLNPGGLLMLLTGLVVVYVTTQHSRASGNP